MLLLLIIGWYNRLAANTTIKFVVTYLVITGYRYWWLAKLTKSFLSVRDATQCASAVQSSGRWPTVGRRTKNPLVSHARVLILFMASRSFGSQATRQRRSEKTARHATPRRAIAIIATTQNNATFRSLSFDHRLLNRALASCQC